MTCRLIDRPVRPLFPDGYRFETQIVPVMVPQPKGEPVRVDRVDGVVAGVVLGGGRRRRDHRRLAGREVFRPQGGLQVHGNVEQ